MTSISTKYLLENAEVTKNKNDQSNPKNGGQTPKPPMPLAARHWFQRVQNPDPKKIHSASKSCSKPKPSTKRVVKFTKSTHMINGVLLLGFQCPNAQTLATWLTACLKHGWIIVSIKTQATKITSKPNTKAPQCHWLPTTRFQRVQNPDPNKLHNASKSCSRQKTSTKIMLSRYLTIRRWEKQLIKMNWMDGSTMDGL